MDNVLDNTTDVPVLLGKVNVAETSGVLVVVGVGLEDPPRLPLGSDNALDVSCGSGAYEHSSALQSASRRRFQCLARDRPDHLVIAVNPADSVHRSIVHDPPP